MAYTTLYDNLSSGGSKLEVDLVNSKRRITVPNGTVAVDHIEIDDPIYGVLSGGILQPGEEIDASSGATKQLLDDLLGTSFAG